MKRGILTGLLLLSFLFSAMVLPHRPSDALDSIPAGWVGIYDRAGLEAISAAPEKQYILMRNIDLSDGPWTALCSSDTPFTGVLDGNGYTISGMTVSDGVNPCGLFSYLSGGTVKSLTVKGSASGPIAGLIAGKADHGTVQGCTVMGTVSSDFFGGGMLGQIRGQGVTVTQCTSTVALSGTGSADGELFLGGICGAVYGTGQVLSQCEFNGSIAPAGSHLYVGGIAGEIHGGANGTVSVATCISSGSLTLSSYKTLFAGGIVGRMSQGSLSVSDCSFHGTWGGGRCDGTLYLGGIVGRAEASVKGEIIGCVSLGSVSGVGHPDYAKDSGGDYRCTVCSARLGETVSENSGMSVGFVNLEIEYTSFVGGILGYGLADGGTLTVSQCGSSSTVSATGSPVMLGGISGINRADSGTALMTDCFFGGRVVYASAPHGELASAIGGIVGTNGGFSTATVQRCVSTCEPEGVYVLGTGAVAGVNSPFYVGDGVPENQVTVVSCYVFTENDSCGTALSGLQMSNPASFDGFDFTSLWQINPATELPNPCRGMVTPATFPRGDVDGNGQLTRLDAVLLNRYLSGDSPLTAAQLQRADFDGNGTVNSRDVTALMQSTAS